MSAAQVHAVLRRAVGALQAEVQAVTSVAPINAWAAKVTNGMITQAVPPNTEFNMIITNAVYFKGLWEYGFDKAATRKRDFYALTSSGANKVRFGLDDSNTQMGPPWPVHA
jgi:serine protease inhibitor